MRKSVDDIASGVAKKVVELSRDRLAQAIINKAYRRKSVFNDTDVIRVLSRDNPKAMKTKARRRFAKYRTGMTVAEYREAIRDPEVYPSGVVRYWTTDDLKRDVAHGYIEVIENLNLPTLEEAREENPWSSTKIEIEVPSLENVVDRIEGELRKIRGALIRLKELL